MPHRRTVRTSTGCSSGPAAGHQQWHMLTRRHFVACRSLQLLIQYSILILLLQYRTNPGTRGLSPRQPRAARTHHITFAWLLAGEWTSCYFSKSSPSFPCAVDPFTTLLCSAPIPFAIFCLTFLSFQELDLFCLSFIHYVLTHSRISYLPSTTSPLRHQLFRPLRYCTAALRGSRYWHIKNDSYKSTYLKTTSPLPFS